MIKNTPKILKGFVSPGLKKCIPSRSLVKNNKKMMKILEPQFYPKFTQDNLYIPANFDSEYGVSSVG